MGCTLYSRCTTHQKEVRRNSRIDIHAQRMPKFGENQIFHATYNHIELPSFKIYNLQPSLPITSTVKNVDDF